MADLLIGRNDNGEYITAQGDEHVALHARTGAGKGVGFVIPNCFAWPGSMIVLDIKGDAFRATAGYRMAMGQDVYLLQPDTQDGRSHRWNPLDAIDRGSIDRFDQIQRQASLLFPEVDQIGGGANHNKFWDDVGRQSFAAVMRLAAEVPHDPMNMEGIANFFHRPDGYDLLEAGVAAMRKQMPGTLSQITVESVAGYIGNEAKLRNEIRTTVSTRLQLWASPKIAALTATSDFDLRKLRREPMTVYVVVAPGNVQWLRPLLRLFFDQAIALNTDVTPREDPSLKVPLLFMMDEFARLGRVDSLAQAPQYVRDYGIRMAYVVQDQEQMRAIYGKEGANDIFGNLGAEVVFGTASLETAKELEERIGDNTQMFKTTSRPRWFGWMQPKKQSEVRASASPTFDIGSRDPANASRPADRPARWHAGRLDGANQLAA